MWIPGMLRRLVVQVVLEELEVGGHCGCCGVWVEHCIVEAIWPYTVCEKCIRRSLDEELIERTLRAIYAKTGEAVVERGEGG